MTLENYLAEAGALAGLAGILAGFSLSAVVQLLSAGEKTRLETAEVVIFSAASVMFLYTLIVAVLSFSAAAELNRIPNELDNLNVGGFLILCGAIYVFLTGIGVAGWIRSKIAGVLTTFFALLSMCMVSYALVSVLSLFT
ncbi:MAG: hypothetical protein Q8L87_13185 [Anaerolineales bacterium]|jgi:hypothetical protein|nr:hypothetical protein [Anaerolineales bacterium]